MTSLHSDDPACPPNEVKRPQGVLTDFRGTVLDGCPFILPFTAEEPPKQNRTEQVTVQVQEHA